MSQAEFKIGDRVETRFGPVFGNAFVPGDRGTVVGLEEGPIYIVQLDVHVPGDTLEFLPGALRDAHVPDTTPKPNSRAELLDEAKALITGDRNNSYGEPTQDFQRSADALTGLGYGKKDHEGFWVGLEAHDVSILVMAIKLSRLQWSPGKRDHWADIAGYAGCGYECAVKEGHAE